MSNVEHRPDPSFGSPSRRPAQLDGRSDARAAAAERPQALGFRRTAQLIRLPLLLLVVCQIADLVTFTLAVSVHGPAHESGPLRFVYQDGGLMTVAVLKVTGALLSAVVLALHPWRNLATPRRLALLSAAVGAFGAFTNVWAVH
jgi:hypothetical protein